MDNKMFHPEIFERQQTEPLKNDRTLLSLRQQRDNLIDVDIKDLQSPGSFKFTIDDTTLTGSNTRHLFKNLYGETPLTFLFFSNRNIENIQKLIRMGVYKNVNQVVDNQSPKELLVIMRSIFLEYHAHPPLINSSMPKKEIEKLKKMYTDEVERLNKITIDTVIPLVVSGMKQYVDYIRDISMQPKQINRAINDSVKGEREYRSITQVLLGSDL